MQLNDLNIYYLNKINIEVTAPLNSNKEELVLLIEKTIEYI